MFATLVVATRTPFPRRRRWEARERVDEPTADQVCETEGEGRGGGEGREDGRGGGAGRVHLNSNEVHLGIYVLEHAAAVAIFLCGRSSVVQVSLVLRFSTPPLFHVVVRANPRANLRRFSARLTAATSFNRTIIGR